MSISERYVELCLRLGRHDDDVIDFYLGPPELAERIAQEPFHDARQLAADAHELAGETDSEYLRAQLRGLETVARLLVGDEIPYAEEVEACYGIPLRRIPEEDFEAAHAALDEVLPPGGTMAQRHQRWIEGDPIPPDRIEAVLLTVGEALRELTRDLVGLPDGETFELELVNEKHWYAFNDYRGDLQSRVEVNVDLPINAASVVALLAHELYPGHHTERTWKEALLVRRGHLEETLLPYGTPQCVITEGIAQLAMDMVIGEHGALVADAFQEVGIAYDADLAWRFRQADEPLHRVIANVAALIHADGVSPEDARAYLQRWELSTEERADQHVRFVMDRWGKAYIRTYTDGQDLCRNWVNGDLARFKRLLTEQLTPGDLQA